MTESGMLCGGLHSEYEHDICTSRSASCAGFTRAPLQQTLSLWTVAALHTYLRLMLSCFQLACIPMSCCSFIKCSALLGFAICFEIAGAQTRPAGAQHAALLAGR